MNEANRLAGGRWLEALEKRHLRGRRRATLCAVLAVLWVFPSIGAIWILWMNWRAWSEASTLIAGIRGTRLEQWMALGLLASHAGFVFFAMHYARHEPRLGQDEDTIKPLPDEGPGIGG